MGDENVRLRREREGTDFVELPESILELLSSQNAFLDPILNVSLSPILPKSSWKLTVKSAPFPLIADFTSRLTSGRYHFLDHRSDDLFEYVIERSGHIQLKFSWLLGNLFMIL